MIRMFAVIAIALALIVAVHDRETDGPAQASDQRIETGWQGFDSILADNLSADTHSTISGAVGGPTDVFRSWGDKFAHEVKNATEQR